MTDSIELRTLSYDSGKETASFSFAAIRSGKSAPLWGSVRVPTDGDLKESEIDALIRAEVKKLLLDAAAKL